MRESLLGLEMLAFLVGGLLGFNFFKGTSMNAEDLILKRRTWAESTAAGQDFRLHIKSLQL